MHAHAAHELVAINAHTNTYAGMYICTYTHTNIHTNIYTRTRTCRMCACGNVHTQWQKPACAHTHPNTHTQ